MKLRLATPPSGTLEMLRLKVGTPSPAPLAEAAGAKASPPARGAISVGGSLPIPSYSLSVRDMADMDPARPKELLKKAGLSSWTYVLVERNEISGLAEVAKRGSTVVFVARYPRQIARQVVQQVERAEKEVERRGGNYELRLLRASGVSLQAVWLHGPDDLFLVVPRAPGDLDWQEVYTVEQLVDALAPVARRRARSQSREGPNA